jgi:hypothetical protein
MNDKGCGDGVEVRRGAMGTGGGPGPLAGAGVNVPRLRAMIAEIDKARAVMDRRYRDWKARQ